MKKILATVLCLMLALSSTLALAEVKRTDEAPSQAVAMKASAYHYENENATSRPTLVAAIEPSKMRKNDLMPLKPALSSTRGMK